MKRIVKTKEELLATEGVKYDSVCGSYSPPSNLGDCFFIKEMRHLCGKELSPELDEDDDGDVIYGGYMLEPWMWKEVEDETETNSKNIINTEAIETMKSVAERMNAENKIIDTANKLKEIGGLMSSYVGYKDKADQAKRKIEALSKELSLNIKL